MQQPSKRRLSDGARDPSAALPPALVVAAGLAWRLLVVLVAVGVLGWLLGFLAVVTVPLAAALLLAALFGPLVARLERWRVPRGLATTITVVCGLVVLGGMVTLVVITVSDGWPGLRAQLQTTEQTLVDWLQSGPLHLSARQVGQVLNEALNSVSQVATASGALSAAASVGEAITGVLLTVFALIFFLHSGRRIWAFTLLIVPGAVRDRADVAGSRGYAALVGFVRATVVIAVIDAVLIGLGMVIVGVPLAIPLAALIFLGAFVPVLGSLVTGTLAAVITLVTNDLLDAVIVAAIVIGVMQLESHLLQPLLLGRAVRLHPLAVVIAIAIGLVVAGIPGALVAVPVLAVSKAATSSLLYEPSDPPGSVNPTDSTNATDDDAPTGHEP